MSHLPDLLTYTLLSISITHLAWVLVDSELMRPYREWASSLGPIYSYMSQCVICTTTQLSLLLCWVPGWYPFDLGGWLSPISYALSSLLLAKTSLVLGSLFEFPPYLAGLCIALSRYLDSMTYSQGAPPLEGLELSTGPGTQADEGPFP